MKFCTNLLLPFVLILVLGSSSSAADISESGDLVKHIENILPNGWKVEMLSWRSKTFLKIKTVQMKTDASMHGSGEDGETRELAIMIKVLPNYTKSMLLQIKEHNQPIYKQLKALDYYSAPYNTIHAQLLDEPMFHNGRYGFSVEEASFIPHSAQDKATLRAVLKKMSSDWVAYEDKNQDVQKALEYLVLN